MIEIGTCFSLIDGTWGLLFPDYYKAFRSMNSTRHVACIKVLDRVGDSYNLSLMEIAPDDGRLFALIGVFVVCTEHDIKVATALTNKRRRGKHLPRIESNA